MAAMTSRCCLNLDSTSIPLPKSNTLRAVTVQSDEKQRKPKLGMGMACAMIGLQMAISTPNVGLITAHPDAAMATEIITIRSGGKGPKWSDRRRCPSWNTNALETIVPENLPRPSAHRRSEAVDLNHHVHVHVVVNPNTVGCFSM